MFDFLRYGITSKLWSKLSQLLIKLGGPRLAAYLTYMSIDWGPLSSNQTILCLGRETFLKDIEQLRRRTEFNYPVVLAGFTRFQASWFPREMQIQTFYQAHVEANESPVQAAIEYAEKLLRLVSKKVPVDGVLSANIDYWQDIGFKRVCSMQGIPFLVLSREHPIIPSVCAKVSKRYRDSGFNYEGSGIAVAGPSTKGVILSSGKVCRPEQVFITGLPRYDAWLDVDTSKRAKQRCLITLLTFSRGYGVDNTFVEVLEAFCAASHKYRSSGCQFLVKTKDSDDTHYIHKQVSPNLLSEVQCRHDVDLFEVLPDSRLVIGYNSLALVESVMANAWTVIPGWGECCTNGDNAMYKETNTYVTPVIDFAKNENQLWDAIRQGIKGVDVNFSKREAINFIQEYVYVPKKHTISNEFSLFLDAYLFDQRSKSKK